MKQVRNVSIALILLLGASYGAGRIYYRYTDGFLLKHIKSDLAYDPRWEVTQSSEEEQEVINQLLSQPFFYLGKGCQSYAFKSADDQYVVKFFKFQRFKTTIFLDFLAFVPTVGEHRISKLLQKDERRVTFFASWVLAFEKLKKECGLVYLHLNKSSHLKKQLIIYDKMGWEHHVDLDQVEFLIQKKATLLRPYLGDLIHKGELEKGKECIDKIIAMIVSEYRRGLADDDHALMQNTGICNGEPIHIDVGQFTESSSVLDLAIAHQELFTKMYRFREWLKKQSAELSDHIEEQLHTEIGDSFFQMEPKFRPHQN